jgi:hypothetical protein
MHTYYTDNCGAEIPFRSSIQEQFSFGNARLFHFHFLSLRDVLSNRNHSDRMPRCIAIRRAVEKEVDGVVALGVELNFSVLRRSASKSFLDETLHHIV